MENSHIEIRPADEHDAVLLSVLATTTFFEAYFEQDESANLAAYINGAFGVDSIREEIADPASSSFIILVNGKAAGFARMIDGSNINSAAPGSVVEIRRIYIVERLWRTGLGSRLLRHCIDTARARGFESLWLEAWEENARARNFYARFGFVETGKVSKPYGNVTGINLVLELSLQPA